MKPFATLMLLALIIFGAACAERPTYTYKNSYSLTKPLPSKEKLFADDTLSARFWIDEKKIHFTLTNKSNFPLEINWKEARFINLDGKKHPLANGTALFSNNRRNPEPSFLSPGDSLTDYVAPVGNVKKLEEWTWYLYPLFNLQTSSAPKNKGKTFGIDLPISSQGATTKETHTYTFRFIINTVQSVGSFF